MLENVDLKQKLDKETYKAQKKDLEERLAGLQQTIKDLKIPIIIALEGWSASGKGTFISKILYPMDPRQFNVYTMGKITEEIKMRPFLWSYWTKTPCKGRITIFDKSWCRGLMPQSVSNWNMSDSERKGYYQDVNAFEQQLYDDGTLIIKIFFHLSKEEQKKRFKELEKNPDTRWRVDQKDWEQNARYDQCLNVFEKMMQNTNIGPSQWSVVEADDKKYATIKMFKIIIHKIEEEIQRRSEPKPEMPLQDVAPSISLPDVSILSSIDLSRTISEAEYKKKVKHYQDKIAELGYKLYDKRKSVVIAYEGWDAAGKGGNIKRITEELDPRAYEVVPIASPTQEELEHHYLWRFYNKMPKDGHIAIFDRTWYGRVLVERVEGYCTQEEWTRAYKEMNEMEQHWTNHGTILFKFWMQIDKDEQLLRFNARQADPLKQYKITDEDWRNREKWDLYEKAIDEMLFRTSTEYAPWTIVESNDKKFARVKTLEIVADELEKRLK